MRTLCKVTPASITPRPVLNDTCFQSARDLVLFWFFGREYLDDAPAFSERWLQVRVEAAIACHERSVNVNGGCLSHAFRACESLQNAVVVDGPRSSGCPGPVARVRMSSLASREQDLLSCLHLACFVTWAHFSMSATRRSWLLSRLAAPSWLQ